MPSDEIHLQDELTPEQAESYRRKIAGARGRTPIRATGPVRSNMPSSEEMARMRDLPEGGDVQLTGKEISNLVATSSPTSRLAVPGRLSKETLEGLEAMKKANTPSPVTSPGDDDVPEEEAQEDVEEDDVASMKSLLSGRRAGGPLTQVRAIYNDTRREQIEKNLAPIDIALVLTNQDVIQKVEIAPGATVAYRSLSGLESEFVPRYIWDRYKGELTYEMNELAKSLVSLTLCIVGVSGRNLPEHRNRKGGVDLPTFERKWEELLKYPGFLLEAMDINRVWFLERCADSLKVADLGNG